MKIRTGFVSNSSSSSYIIIRSKEDLKIDSKLYFFDKEQKNNYVEYICHDSFHSTEQEYNEILRIFKLFLDVDKNSIIRWDVTYDTGSAYISYLSYNEIVKSIENVDVGFDWLNSPENEDDSDDVFDKNNLKLKFYDKNWKDKTDKVMRKIKLLKLNNTINSNDLIEMTNYSKLCDAFDLKNDNFYIKNDELF